MSKSRIMKDVDNIKKLLEEHGINSKTFCFAPYVSLDLDQSGKMFSCYRGKGPIGNWKENDISKELDNDKYKKLRDDLYNGIKADNCRSCWVAEKHKSISPRFNFFSDLKTRSKEGLIEMIKRIKTNHTKSDISEIKRTEIRTSSLCNLQCMHCSPDSSTQWINFLKDKKVFKKFKKHAWKPPEGVTHENIHIHYKDSLTGESKHPEILEKVLSNSGVIQFSGGEPLLDPQHYDWLKYFIETSKTAKDMHLDYNSNLNIPNIEKFIPLWKQFKGIEFRVSIDSSPTTYEYFRRKGDIKLVEKNIGLIQHEMKYPHLKFYGSITFSMFAALRWKEIIDWWIENKLMFHASLILPSATSSVYLPNSLKEKAATEMRWIMDNISNLLPDDFPNRDIYIEDVIDSTDNCLQFMMNSELIGESLMPNSYGYFKMLDEHTDLKLLDYFPEFQSFYSVDRSTNTMQNSIEN